MIPVKGNLYLPACFRVSDVLHLKEQQIFFPSCGSSSLYHLYASPIPFDMYHCETKTLLYPKRLLFAGFGPKRDVHTISIVWRDRSGVSSTNSFANLTASDNAVV